MAEALTSKMSAGAGLKKISVSSCGTAVSPLYKVPQAVVSLMAEEGMDISAHRPAQMTEKHLMGADIVLVMDDYHKKYIASVSPGEQSKVFLLKEYIGDKDALDIPDPIGHPDDIYRKTKDEIKECVIKLIGKLKADN